MNEVLACTATVLSLYVSCSCSVVFGWIWNSPPSLPAKRAAGCMGQWSAQLTSLLLVWSQASPGVQMHSSALDIFTVHSILLDIIFTIALGLVCIALFQINDHTIYLLGFYSFSGFRPKLQLCPNFWLGHVVEPFMEALGSQRHAGLAARAAPHLTGGTPAQVTTKEPLVCLSTCGCPIHCFLCAGGGGFQPCSADVLLCDKVGPKPLKRMPEARPASGGVGTCCWPPVIIQASPWAHAESGVE